MVSSFGREKYARMKVEQQRRVQGCGRALIGQQLTLTMNHRTTRQHVTITSDLPSAGSVLIGDLPSKEKSWKELVRFWTILEQFY